MNTQLSNNEQKIVDILNNKNDINDIWVNLNDLTLRVDMDNDQLELALYFLQMRGMIRVSMDEMGSVKLATEDKVKAKLSDRANLALGGMEETMQGAVDEEDYEEAAKIRDYIVMAKDPAKQDELIKSLLEDIDDEID